MSKFIKWTLTELCELIKETTANKFDFIIFIDGRRGTGKSTLAYKLALRIKKNFNPWKDILFSREEVLKQLTLKKNDLIIADEMINVSYRRDFYLEDQKNLIKYFNMYRDSCNVFIGCVPTFVNIDKDLLKMVKMRITVVRRGLAVVQIPNNPMYNPDPWDIEKNRKIEMSWMNMNKPRYSKLTTFAGYLEFGDLKPTSRKIYEAVKQEKRARLLEPDKANDEKEPFDRLYDLVKAKLVTKEELQKYTNIMGISYNVIVTKLNAKLKEDKDIPEGLSLKDYLKKKKTDKELQEEILMRKKPNFQV